MTNIKHTTGAKGQDASGEAACLHCTLPKKICTCTKDIEQQEAVMTKHYYYTDPLAAAWMAKYFGITFYGWEWSDDEFTFNSTVHQDDDDTREPICFDGTRVYIHQDSLHLLEPQTGDLVTWGYNERDICEGIFTWSSPGDVHPDNYVKIIIRNGKAFHWPESEEV